MSRAFLRAGGIALTSAVVALGSAATGGAHKPITSPFTFNEDVLPIVKARCGGCHRPGGVAPMSLLTHAEAVPWGESMRAELMAGHMPPWRVDSRADRFRNLQPMTGRELNVLLTWASGGTPAGDPVEGGDQATAAKGWPLGAPDLQLPMPAAITIPAQEREHIAEFVLPAATDRRRLLRALDLLPGTPAIVRSATVSVRTSAADPGAAERLVLLWIPGDHPAPADPGSGFELPADADLVVRINYRKTWEHENRAMSDRSTLGLYFADEPAAAIRPVALAASLTPGGAATTATTLVDGVRALALYPDPSAGAAAVTVTAVRPDGTRDTLIAFHPRPGWARRYWFREPIVLPRGTRLELQARADEPLLPPGALAPAASTAAGRRIALTVNVVPER